ncbi:MAG TPA: FHA domain-containing protein [Firmicutes bacterium]|nr:FHA domain-containing protein [Bacillota bacterium]
MTELLLWAGRVAVLVGLLAYLWAVAGRLARGVGSAAGVGSGSPPGGEARLELVQDYTVDGVRPGLAGERLALRQAVPVGDELTLGRDEDNALVIGDRYTSGRHARIFRQDGAFWLEDLGSKNGTLLNGHRVTGPRRLAAGDRITVGSCTFRFMG